MNDEIDAVARAVAETHSDQHPDDHSGAVDREVSKLRGKFGDLFNDSPNHGPDYARRRLAAAGIGALALIVTCSVLHGAYSNNAPDSPGQNTTPSAEAPVASTYDGPLQLTDRVSSVIISDGARLREAPVVDNIDASTTGNIVEEVKLGEGKTIEVMTPEGVYIENDDANGSWFGIKIEDLPAELAEGAKADKDGVVWVSTQKADPTYTDISKS